MRLPTGLLLPLLAGAASAISDAKVYLFQDDEWSKPSDPPVLSPEDARLVFAQRLGVSQYHSLDDAGEDTLAYINRFGGRQNRLFEAGRRDNKAAELVIFAEGASTKKGETIANAWSSVRPAFTISNPPSSSENLELVLNMERQLGLHKLDCTFEENIDPRNWPCWKGKSKITQIDLAAERTGMGKVTQDTLTSLAKSQQMNVIVVLMPESSWSTKSNNSYGAYEKPPQKHFSRRELPEEPITETQTTSSGANAPTSSSSPEYIRGVAPLCYTSLESCISSTNSCSGHGECYKKTNGTDSTASCFSCQCKPQEETRTSDGKTYRWITYWGGGACQKQDISVPFWLLASFTVALVGVIGWSIGMLYSVGEEKLPGVIGAGVSSKTG